MFKRISTWLAVATIATAGALVGPQLASHSSVNGPLEGVASAQPLLHGTADTSIADVTERVLPSVVSISTKATVHADQTMFFGQPFGGMFPFGGGDQIRRGLGSGVIVSKKGYILTNNHVVDGAETITVHFPDGRTTKAKVVGTDPKSDLAVVRLEKHFKNLQPLPMGSSSKLRLGEVVLAIGNPMGVGQSVTMGIVSAKGRGGMGIEDYEDFIQTDAAINPGNSGGALVNMRGELVGINTAILSRSGGNQGIGFAIPTDMARPIMNMLIKNGHVTRGYLGVSIQNVDEDLTQALGLQLGNHRGALVADVIDGSPAAKAGLKRNDVIVALDGNGVKNSNQLRNRIAARGAGTVVNVQVVRNGHELQIPVKLGQLPEDQGVAANDDEHGDKATFGVRIAPINRKTREQLDLPRDLKSGVVITDVQRGSTAARIGLRPGDVILEINRHKIHNASEFKRAYQHSGHKLALLVYRNGGTSYVVVTK